MLEQRNNRYRELLLDQASTQGYDAYTKYHPISAITPLFNIKAIEGYEKSMNEKEVRPDTGATTVNYVIGGVNNEIKRVSRPVTVKGKPVLSKVNGEIEFDFIDDAVDTSYPPKFPLVTPNGSRKIKSSRSTPKKPLTAKARPNTAKSFKWDHETIDYV